ncbi:acylneuraminate cytidylyltransferase family protein [Segetibacter sp.]|jgi:CMP-N,N'-diacetyllegionaminic acid synthase|uniref:acylneuraminate cytidylyltransferase family protein n=1 Tax=Segetibacter sp. TaxID=2231182 RepID=UPI00260682A5|nr:acylneuraminate cytidylyltransferase family protein [Segetibacter sp.]
MKNLCIIPARSGSKGVPGKNIKPLSGKPLIHYTFEAAVECSFLDKIILSTDCTTIAESAKNASIEVPFLRPKYLADDTAPTLEVIKHALQYFDNRGEWYDNICLLQPTCPFRSEGFVDRCFENFVASAADCLVSVKLVPHEYNPHWVFEADALGYLRIATGEEAIIPSRQLLPKSFARDGSVYIFKADNIRNRNSIFGKTISYLQSDDMWHINIDTAEDWKRAEMIAKMLFVVS